MTNKSVFQNIQQTTHEHHDHATNFKVKSTKELAEFPTLTSISPNYVYFHDLTSAVDHSDDLDHHDYDVPVIDFSLLESHDPGQRSKVVQDLGKACLEWGFFMVVNHGVPERLIKSMIDKCNEFFNLSVEEKHEFEGKNVLEPIRYGSSFTSTDPINFWRDYLKLMVHPHFHSPTHPPRFSETSSEYSKHVRRVVRGLLRGISSSLGLDENEIEKSMNLDMGQQILVANYYPPCPEPNLAIGMPPHSDHGLLTILTQNQVGGLQIQHRGKWVSINAHAHAHAFPNAFLVNTGDHLEILSNGKYKSVMHRAIVNNKVTRMSIANANGPSLDTIVMPATQLTNGVGAKYKPMIYKDYLLFQQTNRLDGKSCLDIVRL